MIAEDEAEPEEVESDETELPGVGAEEPEHVAAQPDASAAAPPEENR